MPFIFLGIIVLIGSLFLFRQGVKGKSHEMKNGSLALILAGLFLLLWGAVLVFTGNLAVDL